MFTIYILNSWYATNDFIFKRNRCKIDEVIFRKIKLGSEYAKFFLEEIHLASANKSSKFTCQLKSTFVFHICINIFCFFFCISSFFPFNSFNISLTTFKCFRLYSQYCMVFKCNIPLNEDVSSSSSLFSRCLSHFIGFFYFSVGILWPNNFHFSLSRSK